jgi:hypothetical protein
MGMCIFNFKLQNRKTKRHQKEGDRLGIDPNLACSKNKLDVKRANGSVYLTDSNSLLW